MILFPMFSVLQQRFQQRRRRRPIRRQSREPRHGVVETKGRHHQIGLSAQQVALQPGKPLRRALTADAGVEDAHRRHGIHFIQTDFSLDG